MMAILSLKLVWLGMLVFTQPVHLATMKTSDFALIYDVRLKFCEQWYMYSNCFQYTRIVTYIFVKSFAYNSVTKWCIAIKIVPSFLR